VSTLELLILSTRHTGDFHTRDMAASLGRVGPWGKTAGGGRRAVGLVLVLCGSVFSPWPGPIYTPASVIGLGLCVAIVERVQK
jgi:hypothetical protein